MLTCRWGFCRSRIPGALAASQSCDRTQPRASTSGSVGPVPRDQRSGQEPNCGRLWGVPWVGVAGGWLRERQVTSPSL